MKELIIETKIKVYSPEELPHEYKLLEEKARHATGNAYAPYSNFHVGAAVLLENGEIVTGCNQENAAYPSGLCAERVALFYAGSQYPDIPVRAIAIAAEADGKRIRLITPCGACRQVLQETQTRSGKPVAVLLCGSEFVYIIEDASMLLPLSFDGSDLPKDQ